MTATNELAVARAVAENGKTNVACVDSVTLDYEGRYLRRKVLTCESGEKLLVDLAAATVLNDGDMLKRDDGAGVKVVAADEDLIEARAGSEHDLVRLAYHLGNRHLPVQIEHDRLLIQRDHVIEDMLEKLGAEVRTVREPFNPEGGAYGHGRTLGHDHGAGHDHHHSHGHSHD